MNNLFIKNGQIISLREIPLLNLEEFQACLKTNLDLGHSILNLFTAELQHKLYLFYLIGNYQLKKVEIAYCPVSEQFQSLSRDYPQLERFEREIYEQYGILPLKHPWLKPVRFEKQRSYPELNLTDYPFYTFKGEEVHEVAVGPVHAGVIEPGHFRFQCHGEKVYHLEIQLGYQHRGIEQLLLKSPLAKQQALIESICGDSTIAYSTAYCQIIEALSSIEISSSTAWTRLIALELERIAMHLADLAGIAIDIAYLPAGAAFGRIRTLIINQMLRICGSRFGRWWLCPGGINYIIDQEMLKDIQNTLNCVKKDMTVITDLMLDTPSVLSRLETTGQIQWEKAKRLGLTGFIGRTAGINEDMRRDLPCGYYTKISPDVALLTQGDAWARTILRLHEIDNSFNLLTQVLTQAPPLKTIIPAPPLKIAKNSLAISVVEGWRGGIVHCVITGDHGETVRYKVKDPSFHNWQSLAMAMRGNMISDFPLCNKSHNLSYCGHDL